MSKNNFIATIICLFALNNFSQNEKLNHTTTNNLKISGKKIVEILSFFSDEEPGGTFIINQDGNHIASGAVGKSNLELGINMNVNNVFNIASLTKPFTSVAIFTLIEKGLLHLDDKISKHISDFPKEGENITIGHLLSHSSGMEYKNDEKERNSFKKAIQEKREDNSINVIEYFTKEKFNKKPGNEYDYNNAAYQLLGYLIELKSGLSYEDYLNKVFFKPLNMSSTLLDSNSKEIKNKALGYDSFNGGEYKPISKDEDDSYFYAAGGIVSSVNDLSVWFNNLMNYKIISKSNVEKLTSPIKYNDGSYGANGYGLFTGNLNGYKYVFHDGLTWGYGAIALYFPELKLFIAHLRNCGYCKYDVGLSYNSPIKMAAVLLNSEYSNKTLNKKILDEYVGVYQSVHSKKEKTIIAKNQKLYLKSKRFGLLPLLSINENTFFVERNNETIVFKKDSKNKLVLVSNRGVSITFKKQL